MTASTILFGVLFVLIFVVMAAVSTLALVGFFLLVRFILKVIGRWY